MASLTSRRLGGVLGVIGVGAIVLALSWVFAQPEAPQPNIRVDQAITIARDGMSVRGVAVQNLEVASVTLKYNTGRMIANGRTRLVWTVRLVGVGESAVYGGPVIVDAMTGDILYLGSY